MTGTYPRLELLPTSQINSPFYNYSHGLKAFPPHSTDTSIT